MKDEIRVGLGRPLNYGAVPTDATFKSDAKGDIKYNIMAVCALSRLSTEGLMYSIRILFAASLDPWGDREYFKCRKFSLVISIQDLH